MMDSFGRLTIRKPERKLWLILEDSFIATEVPLVPKLHFAHHFSKIADDSDASLHFARRVTIPFITFRRNMPLRGLSSIDLCKLAGSR